MAMKETSSKQAYAAPKLEVIGDVAKLTLSGRKKPSKDMPGLGS